MNRMWDSVDVRRGANSAAVAAACLRAVLLLSKIGALRLRGP